MTDVLRGSSQANHQHASSNEASCSALLPDAQQTTKTTTHCAPVEGVAVMCEHESQVVVGLALHHQLHWSTEATQQTGHRLNLFGHMK
jgi:hypothetical protein